MKQDFLAQSFSSPTLSEVEYSSSNRICGWKKKRLHFLSLALLKQAQLNININSFFSKREGKSQVFIKGNKRISKYCLRSNGDSLKRPVCDSTGI